MEEVTKPGRWIKDVRCRGRRCIGGNAIPGWVRSEKFGWLICKGSGTLDVEMSPAHNHHSAMEAVSMAPLLPKR